jgi:hypothetical protein
MIGQANSGAQPVAALAFDQGVRPAPLPSAACSIVIRAAVEGMVT